MSGSEHLELASARRRNYSVTKSLVADTPRRCRSRAAGIALSPCPATSALGVSQLDEAQEAVDQAEEDADLKAREAAQRASGVPSYPV
jgi:hypothetical protein